MAANRILEFGSLLHSGGARHAHGQQGTQHRTCRSATTLTTKTTICLRASRGCRKACGGRELRRKLENCARGKLWFFVVFRVLKRLPLTPIPSPLSTGARGGRLPNAGALRFEDSASRLNGFVSCGPSAAARGVLARGASSGTILGYNLVSNVLTNVLTNVSTSASIVTTKSFGARRGRAKGRIANELGRIGPRCERIGKIAFDRFRPELAQISSALLALRAPENRSLLALRGAALLAIRVAGSESDIFSLIDGNQDGPLWSARQQTRIDQMNRREFVGLSVAGLASACVRPACAAPEETLYNG